MITKFNINDKVKIIGQNIYFIIQKIYITQDKKIYNVGYPAESQYPWEIEDGKLELCINGKKIPCLKRNSKKNRSKRSVKSME